MIIQTKSANKEDSTNGFYNRAFEQVIQAGYEMSDDLRAASFVAPWIDFSAMRTDLHTEASLLIMANRRYNYAVIFIGECSKRGWKGEQGIYYPLQAGRYNLTNKIVERVILEQIETPWLETHPQGTLFNCMQFLARLYEDKTLNGLIASALAKDYRPEPELQLPWQEPKSTIDRFGDAAVHTGGALVGAMLRSFGL